MYSLTRLTQALLLLVALASATELYQGAHDYFGSRSLQGESLVIVLVLTVLAVLFAIYIAYNALFQKKQK